MKVGIINIIVSLFVLSITAGLFYLNRRPAENIDDVTLITLLRNAETNAYNQWKLFPSSRKLKNDT